MARILGLLLLAASLLKAWSVVRYPEPGGHGWLDGVVGHAAVIACEAAFGVGLAAGLWPRRSWHVALAVFSLFALFTALEAWRGETSCGCFGEVHIRPVYTFAFDLLAIAALLITRKLADSRGSESERVGWKIRWLAGGLLAVVWAGAVGAMWSARPAIAAATIASAQGQTFGKPGELVVLEPEKWAGQNFTLAEHIDVGSQLASGRWIVLLVHHDCDHCAAAVPKYVTALGERLQPLTSNPRLPLHLAVIEMPPFGDAADPPPWQLPSSVLSGRLDQTRDWFATTPAAVLIKDGIVTAGKDGESAESPNLFSK